MSNIDNIIADITEVNQTYGFWIRDEDGNLKDDIVCGEVIPFLEELKEYEVEMSQADIKDMMNFWDSNFDVHRSWHNGNNYWRDNTYNCNANIDHDIDYRIVESAHDGVWFAFMVHRYGDVRGNYTDWAVCKFNYVESIFELESVMQYKDIIGKYVADINIFTEGYEVYDYINDKDVGTFYDVEVDDLLNSIAELEGEN